MKKIILFNMIFLFSLFSFSQVKFEKPFNIYMITDSITGFTFGFDSGASRTVIFNPEKMKYKTTGFLPFNNTTGKIKFLKTVMLKEEITKTTNIDTKNIKATILYKEGDLPNYCNLPEVLLDVRILKKHILSFDNLRNEFNVLSKLPDDINSFNKLDLIRNFIDKRYYVKLLINGKEEKFLVDTGSNNSIFSSNKKNLNVAQEKIYYHSLNAFKYENEFIEKYTSNTIQQGDFIFKLDEIFYSPNKNILGNSFFLNFEKVIFDFKNKAIYLKNEYSKTAIFDDEINFEINDDNEIMISIINDKNIFYKAGFRIGDIIKFEDSEFEELLKRNPCDTYLIIRDYLTNEKQLPKFIKK